MHCRFTCLLTALLVAFLLAGCGSSSSNDSPPTASIVGSPNSAAASGPGLADPALPTAQASVVESPPVGPRTRIAPVVLVKTSLGDFKIRLSVEKSPLTVENFLENYVDRGFYSHTTFHYVDKNFIIAGGGYTSDLEAKETRAPIRNEANNGLKNVRGTVAMARHQDYADSATSQFFVNLADNPSLDYSDAEEGDSAGYCVFGEVIVGMDVVDRIAATEVRDTDQFPRLPVEPVVITSIERAN